MMRASIRTAACLAVATCLLGVTGPCAPAAAPSASPALREPELSAGAEGAEGAVGYRGSPLVLTALLLHPDWPSASAAAAPIPIAHPVDWSQLVRFEVTAPDGTLLAWPIVLIPAAAPRVTLDHAVTATLRATVSPAATLQLASGSYRVRAVLDATGVTQAGAYQGRVQSASTRFELRDPIGQPSAPQDEALGVLQATFLLLTGDSAGARVELESLLARQPSSIAALTALSDLDYQQGFLDQAIDGIDAALAAWSALPDPSFDPEYSEPPVPLLERQHAMLNTRIRLANGGPRPALSARISAKAPGTLPDTIEVDVTFTNIGVAAALDARVSAVKTRVLQGAGSVALDSPALPIAIGALAPGASTSVRLVLHVDPGVVRFTLTEEGATGADFGTFGFALTQATYK